MSDSLRRQQIQERVAKATKGPWTFSVVKRGDMADGSVMIGAVAPGHQIRATPPGGSYPSNDGEFIAHAREDVPFLLSRVGELESEIARLREGLSLLSPYTVLSNHPGAVCVLRSDVLAVLASSAAQKAEK